MDTRTLSLKIRRFQTERRPPGWTETFAVGARKGMNLLEALLRIQDEIDPSLTFRYSCRGAVCGSCAMRVNGQVVLACRTHVEPLLGKTVLIEPLPNFPVIRDLLVDLSSLFAHYRRMGLYLHAKSAPSSSERIMDEDKRREIEPYINCILCGACYGVCPAYGRNTRFAGPAILAKAYRFLVDPRDRREREILSLVDRPNSIWVCNTVFQCVKVCPKQVPPTQAILDMRRKILKHRLLSVFSRLFSGLPRSQDRVRTSRSDSEGRETD